VNLRQLEGFDLTRTAWALELDDVALADEHLVGVPGADTAELMAAQARLAAVLSAADAVGAMHADFELALRYSKDRIAFGRPIGSFQAVKHLLADTSLWLEMSKGVVAVAAAAGGESAEGAELAHAAKAFVSERSLDLAHNCFQVFGGIGYTWDHDQHLFLRRLAAEAECFGSPAWHRSTLLDLAGVGR
jgi:alkylation response protein AidB-like acyl-CoA dehydrogenase